MQQVLANARFWVLGLGFLLHNHQYIHEFKLCSTSPDYN